MAKEQQNPQGLQKLKADLKAKTFDRLYIFYGEETFLQHYYLDRVKNALVDELTESFNFHKFTQETFDIREFDDAMNNLPMMAESTFILVDDIDLFKLAEDDRNWIAECLSQIPEYCTVVFTYETVEWKPDKRYKTLWEAIDRNATIVQFAKQSERDLVTWIMRHFAAEGKKINPNLCVYLMELTGGTMTALAGEISKICAYSDADEIVKADIDAVVEPVLDAVVFQMTDLMGQGAFGPALQKLQVLFKMQNEPLAILGAIGAHYRKIGSARILLNQGMRAGDLMSLYGISDYAAKKIMNSAMRLSDRFCRLANSLVMETDYQLKSSYGDGERLIEALVLRLAQEARND